MGRIVVNKHFANERDITSEKFANLGEILISNEVGLEGLYILNSDGEVVKAGANGGGGSDISEEIKEWVGEHLTSAKTYTDKLVKDLEEKLEELIRRQTATGDHLTLTESQYQTIINGGTVVINGIEYTYDEHTYYCIIESSDEPIESGGTIDVEILEDGTLVIDGVDVNEDGVVTLNNAEVLEDGTLVFKASHNTNAEVDAENSILMLFGSGIAVNEEDGTIVLPSTAKVENNTIILN